MANETFAQFEVAGQKLYGMLHLPTGDEPHPAVALLHGFSGHAAESHFIFTKLARALTTDGIAALRFDFRGSGASEGDFSEMTFTSELTDAEAALTFLTGHPAIDPERLGLVGMSFGGSVAATLAARDERVRALVLWSAPAQVELVMRRLLSESGTPPLPGETLDVGGLGVGADFFASLADARPLDALPRYRNATLVVHGTADEVVPVSEASAYVDVLRPGMRQLFVVDGADHTFARLDHERQVIQLTSAWLAAMIG